MQSETMLVDLPSKFHEEYDDVLDSEEEEEEELLLLRSSDNPPKEKLLRALKFIGTLRKYNNQVIQSEGFDIDDWPGFIPNFTSIVPQVCSKELEPEKYERFEYAAMLGIDQYNVDHPETEFEVVEVQKANTKSNMVLSTFYLTFVARDNKAPGFCCCETFQAIVTIESAPLGLATLRPSVRFCRIKA